LIRFECWFASILLLILIYIICVHVCFQYSLQFLLMFVFHFVSRIQCVTLLSRSYFGEVEIDEKRTKHFWPQTFVDVPKNTKRSKYIYRRKFAYRNEQHLLVRSSFSNISLVDNKKTLSSLLLHIPCYQVYKEEDSRLLLPILPRLNTPCFFLRNGHHQNRYRMSIC